MKMTASIRSLTAVVGIALTFAGTAYAYKSVDVDSCTPAGQGYVTCLQTVHTPTNEYETKVKCKISNGVVLVNTCK